MAYTALYRKWRPKTFDDVVGQSHVTTTLKNEIQLGRVGHAFLFCGSRGTGKTSTARILSRAVNCLSPKDGNPCNECENCKGILNGTILDITEIDAASNNGVDNIRELREEARFTGTALKNKIYIVDEVHMLSDSAFNALLKILEEPPAHVKFILATTELHKVPATILSRCQRFDFKRINTDDIESQIKKILDSDGFSSDDKSVRLIAEKADGSMRDALSLLDQCMAIGGKNFSYDALSEFLGSSSEKFLYDIANAIIQKDIANALETSNLYIDSGKNAVQLTNALLEYMRNILLCKYKALKSQSENLSSVADLFTEEQLVYIIKILSDTAVSLRYAENARTYYDIALIKIIKPVYSQNIESLASRMSELEKMAQSPVSAPVSAKPITEDKPQKISKPKPQKTSQQPVNDSELVSTIKKFLPDIKAELIKKSKLAINMALEAASISEKNGRLALVYKTHDDLLAYTNLANSDELKILSEIIFSVSGVNTDIILCEADTNSAQKKDNLLSLSEKLKD